MKNLFTRVISFIMVVCLAVGMLVVGGMTEQVSAFEATKQRPIKDGIYQIASKIDQAYCLDIFAELSMDDIDVILWTRNPNNDFMKFQFTYLGNGYYKIINVGSNKAMEAKNNSSNCGVCQSSWEGSDRQKWKLHLDDNGYFGLAPKSSPSSRINIASGKVGDLEDIEIEPNDGSNAQKWVMIPLELPGKVDVTKFYSNKSQHATVEWKKKSIADGYQVQVAKNDSFTSGKKSYYVTSAIKTFSGLTGGQRYYARVRAYRKAGTRKYYGKWSDIPSVMVLKGKPIAKASLKKVTSPSKKKISIQWGKLSNIDNYEVQISKKSNFASNTIKRTFKKTVTKTSLKGLTSKKTYYVRVRGCRKVSGVNTYGSWSNVKKVKIK